eukprot:5346292-Prymnesium_polylepis.2
MQCAAVSTCNLESREPPQRQVGKIRHAPSQLRQASPVAARENRSDGSSIARWTQPGGYVSMRGRAPATTAAGALVRGVAPL